MDINQEIEGSKDLSQALDVVARIGLRPEPMLDLVGNRLKNYIKLGFRYGKDPYGNRWQPIQRDGQTLVDTGRLRRSIQKKVDREGVSVGTNVEYAEPHQEGVNKTVQVRAHTKLVTQVFGKPLPMGVYANVKAHSKNMSLPARPFMPTPEKGLPSKWEAGIMRTLSGYVQKVIDRAEGMA